MTKLPHWQTSSIFLTSTFRDMHAERDHLRNKIFPELEELLRKRRCHLEPIDLRWGVETVTEDETHEKNLLILKVCLAEVERSRPFLIGFIGDRYGWIPPKDRMSEAAREAGLATDVSGRSITDLEIEFGVLSSDDQQRRCLFYFREPLPYDDMNPDTAADYSERHRPGEESRLAGERLDELKVNLRKALPDRVHDYAVRWDPQTETVTGLEEWGQRVLKDLWRELDDETANWMQRSDLSWQDGEQWALEQFLENRTRDFVGRESTINSLLEVVRAEGDDSSLLGVCVTGDAGAGKSALFSELVRRFGDSDELVLAHSAGISVRSTQVDSMLRRWIGMLSRELNRKTPIDDKNSSREVEAAFHLLLAQVGSRRRVVLLVDALNQFDPSASARHLTWLPSALPPNVRFIATSVKGSESKVLGLRPGVEVQELLPLSESEAVEMVRKICRRYHREINPDIISTVINRESPSGTRAAANPLWLKLAVEELNSLDADDFSRAAIEFEGTPEMQLHRLLMSVASELPTDVEGLYGWMLDRAESIHEESLARAFVDLMAVSRGGWRESDLRILIPAVSGSGWDDLQFAALRRTFRSHIVQSGPQGQWYFTHSQMKAAVLSRNLKDPATARQLHASIADHLNELPRNDALRLSELLIHLIGMNEKKRVGMHLVSDLFDDEREAATSALAYSLRIADDNDAGSISWVDDFLQEFADIQAFHVLVTCLFDVVDELEREGSREPRLRLLSIIKEHIHVVLDGTDELGQLPCLRNMFVCLLKIGDVLVEQGDNESAYEVFSNTVEIAEFLSGPEADWSQSFLEFDTQRDLAVSQINMADNLIAMDRTDEARRICVAAVKFLERLFLDEETESRLSDVSAGRLKLASILRRQGGFEESLQLCETALASLEELAGKGNHDVNLPLGRLEQGKEFEALGNIEEALQAYRLSAAALEQHVRNEPSNVILQRNLSSALLHAGDILFSQGHSEEALDKYLSCIRIHNRIAGIDLSYRNLQSELASFYAKAGEAQKALGNRDEATQSIQACIRILKDLLNRDPSHSGRREALVDSLVKAGDLMLQNHDPDDALIMYEDALRAHQRRAESNADDEYRCEVSRIQLKISATMFVLSRVEDAICITQECLTAQRLLVQEDPANIEWQGLLYRIQKQMGLALNIQEKFDEALEAFRLCCSISTVRSELDPSDEGPQCDLAYALDKSGDLLASLERFDESIESYESSCGIGFNLAGAGPTDVANVQALANTLVKLAKLAQTHRPDEANRHWFACYKILSGLKDAGIDMNPAFLNILGQLEGAFGDSRPPDKLS